MVSQDPRPPAVPESGDCPSCDGKGFFSKYGKPSGDRYRDCLTCNGTGAAPPPAPESVDEGED